MMFQPQNEILPEDVSEEDVERILKRVATEIVSRRLTAPAIFFLESCSPLSFVGSQAMIVLEPFIHAIFDLPDYRRFALMMERRENVNRLITMIEIANQEQKATKNEAHRRDAEGAEKCKEKKGRGNIKSLSLRPLSDLCASAVKRFSSVRRWPGRRKK